MFSFNANIIKRKRISKRSLGMGLISAAVLGYLGFTFLELGLVPLIENLIRQIGLYAYSTWVYAGIFGVLIIALLPAIKTLLQKRTMVHGTISFDEEQLKIVKGKEKFVIPEEQLQEITFDIKALPDGKAKNKNDLFGGSFMRIPTKKGVFECELDIKSKEQELELRNMAEFLKIQHDVKVKIVENK